MATRAESDPAKPPAVSEHQRWEPVTVHRTAIKNAPYNPRKITDKARAKLKKNLARVGLIEPPIWNRRTGNLVGGHQRLAALDSLHKSQDYSLTVAAVELTDKEEREQNVFLNNGEAQGEWDLDKMDELFKLGADVDATGFDHGSIVRLFGCVPGEDDHATAEKMEQIAAKVDAAKKTRAALSEKTGDPFSDDTHYYLVLAGGNDAQREMTTAALGLEDNRYQDLRLVGRLVGLAESLGASRAAVREWVAGTHDDSCDPVLMDPAEAAEHASTEVEGDVE